jgi:hypothetical protein
MVSASFEVACFSIDLKDNQMTVWWIIPGGYVFYSLACFKFLVVCFLIAAAF